MSNSRLSFNEQDEFGNLRVRSGASGITGFLIKNSGGLIKTTKQANSVMLILIVICISLAFIFKPESDAPRELVAPQGKTVVYPAGGGPPKLSE